MDKNILIEYADMKEEIKDLRRRIEQNKKRIIQIEWTNRYGFGIMWEEGKETTGNG